MKKIFLYTAITLMSSVVTNAQWDWDSDPVPADAEGGTWVLQENVSDDFNYTFNAVNAETDFGTAHPNSTEDKWYNFFHNSWDGPGTTYWKYDHTSADGSDLVMKISRYSQVDESLPLNTAASNAGFPAGQKMGRPDDGFNLGSITSLNTVSYPVFVETKISVANLALASDVWLLSSDDTQEIDIIECYGSADNGNWFFSQRLHLSHHTFIRRPFTDWQPSDSGTWYTKPGIPDWGAYCADDGGGNRRYVKVGVYWKSPFHFEYYIDGELKRVMYRGAYAYLSEFSGQWNYYSPIVDNSCDLVKNGQGFQTGTLEATSTNYDFNLVQQASDASPINYIDPYQYQGTTGFTKELDVIINVEAQSWQVSANRIPTNTELDNPAKNNDMLVDWVRAYNRVGGDDIEIGTNEGCDETLSVNEAEKQNLTVYPNPFTDLININSGKSIKKVVISQINGAIVKSFDTEGSRFDIDTSDLAPGIYILRTLSEDDIWATVKLIKS